MDILYLGGRGSSSSEDLADGPTPGGGGGKLWGQPNTPQVPPAPTIAGQIGTQGKPLSPDKAMERANPDRQAIDAMSYSDYTENCQRCVIAYELNRRGYNVEAESTFQRDPMPMGDNLLSTFKGARRQNVGATTTAKVNKNIDGKLENGNRAIVFVSSGRGGHVFNVEKKNGKLHYYDAQTNTKYDPARVFNHVNRREVGIARVDNLSLTDNVRQMVRKSRTNR